MTELHARRGSPFTADESIEITVAANAGACFGVVRAIKLGSQAADRSRALGAPLFSFGPLIHNPVVVAELEQKGLRPVASAAEVASGTVILRSHGVERDVELDLKSRGVQIVDATCPLVKKPQRIAQSLGEKGYFLVVVGNESHPEVKGVLSYFACSNALVTYDPADIDKIPADVKRVGVLAQTTIEARVFYNIAARVKQRFSDVLVYNTICEATSIRQTEAVELARNADVVVVIGGRNSSNTAKLVKICQALQRDTHHIEDLSEIQGHWFRGKRKIGVTAGAATPDDYVDRVGEHIATLIQAARHAEG